MKIGEIENNLELRHDSIVDSKVVSLYCYSVIYLQNRGNITSLPPFLKVVLYVLASMLLLAKNINIFPRDQWYLHVLLLEWKHICSILLKFNVSKNELDVNFQIQDLLLRLPEMKLTWTSTFTCPMTKTLTTLTVRSYF